MMKLPGIRIRVGAGVVIAVVASLAWVFYGPNNFPGGGERVVFVSRGEAFVSVVDSLEAKGVIRNRAMFLLVSRLIGGAEKTQVGKYLMQSGSSNLGIFLMLRSGKGNQLISVSVPEGYRVRAQAKLFARALGIDSSKYARLAFDKDFAHSVGIDQVSLEGYLLPDTYAFDYQQDERDILKRQVENFERFFNDTLKAKCAEYGWDVHNAVTFASIVEGEAVLDEERAIISGVYHNRLQKGMKLEADPTIQYVITDGPRRLLYADLHADTPYNTYLHAGLPPGPVNNPGRASMLASLYPVQHGYLFFVANGRGGHWFTRTYAEHMHYVRMFRHYRTHAMLEAGPPKG
ncbi:MAG TPA: endolytic transglycosylase MltG [Bacteroidota bacterium]|nr:endolytic transglycosylase MltG [Bacteroidota bacterium]